MQRFRFILSLALILSIGFSIFTPLPPQAEKDKYGMETDPNHPNYPDDTFLTEEAKDYLNNLDNESPLGDNLGPGIIGDNCDKTFSNKLRCNIQNTIDDISRMPQEYKIMFFILLFAVLYTILGAKKLSVKNINRINKVLAIVSLVLMLLYLGDGEKRKKLLRYFHIFLLLIPSIPIITLLADKMRIHNVYVKTFLGACMMIFIPILIIVVLLPAVYT